ncbi:hypothetical protein [Pseudonocardia sp. GCM10023141]|uniref:hypothetical protein n=1 Tax=Pseudonocardia sp. GCM10023141 TaxID=3252653 RepID=UPI00361D2CDA
MATTVDTQLSARDVAILREVAGGRAEFLLSALYLEGRCCCDQAAALRLVQDGLIAPVSDGVAAGRVPARLTATGMQALTP